jgi:uncharacterized protein YyaL (SSP411 family)
MASAAATLFMLTADTTYRDRAEHLLRHLAARGPQDVVGSASLQSGFDTLLRGRLAIVVGTGLEADALLSAALDEADLALFAACIKPEAVREGHPAHGKRPARSAAALFLCDAFRCLPEIDHAADAAETLRNTRAGMA